MKSSCDLTKILCVHGSAVDVPTQTDATGVSMKTEIISQNPLLVQMQPMRLAKVKKTPW